MSRVEEKKRRLLSL